jgi:hypothetical protein
MGKILTQAQLEEYRRDGVHFPVEAVAQARHQPLNEFFSRATSRCGSHMFAK